MTHRRLNVTRALLLAYCVLFGVLSGGGLYQHFVIVPSWQSGADIVRTYQHGGGFFPFVTPPLTLIALALAVAGWRSPQPMRRWLYLSVVGFLVLAATTFAYFLPQLIRFESGALDGSGFAEALRQWSDLELPRQLLSPFLLAAGIHAYGLSFRAVAHARDADRTPGHERVPDTPVAGVA